VRTGRWSGGALVAVIVAAALPGAAGAASWTGVTLIRDQDEAQLFDAASGALGPVVPVGSIPERVAIAPDGATAYVTAFSSDDVTPIDLVTATAGPAIAGGSGVTGVAITPDGAAAYVASGATNALVEIDLASGTPTSALPVGAMPWGVAITRDGGTALVANAGFNTVSVVDLATEAVRTTIPVGADPRAVAVTPDGATAVVVNAISDAATLIDVPTATVRATVSVGSGPFDVAIAPDGRTAYTADTGDSAVTPIDLATATAGPPIPLPVAPFGVTVAPDGATLFAAGGGPAAAVIPIDVATGTARPPIDVGGFAYDVAVAPDQAPTAAFSAAAAAPGAPTAFDASGSSSPLGSVVRYDWDFGDGGRASTAGPAVQHVYAAAGEYTVTLTVTNSAGTSLEQVFTGATVSRQGDPRARIAATVSVRAEPPAAGPPLTPAPDAPSPDTPACREARLVLTTVRRQGQRVRLAGVADRALAGRTVELVARGRVVGRAVAGADGAFAVTVPAPSARAARTIRYRARLGAEESYALELERHARVRNAAVRDGAVVLAGRVRGARRGARVELLGRPDGCTRFAVIGRARLGRGGRFRVSAAPFAGAAVYRVRTTLRSGARTYTVPRVVARPAR